MIRKSPVLAILLCVMLLFCGCSKRKASSSAESYYAYAEEPAYEAYEAKDSVAFAAPSNAAAGSASYSSGSSSSSSSGSESSSSSSPKDSGVRKIIYNAEMSVTADHPAEVRDLLAARVAELGGYISASNSTSNDDEVTSVNMTLKVPSAQLEELVETANGLGKVKSYHLYSDDISQRYYDIQARLKSAQAEEAQLLELLKMCESVEDVLLVRESLASVRSDIESYQSSINLWDNLVSYATLELSIRRTPKTAVEEEDEPIPLWKLSDVWSRMKRGFINGARFTANAVGAIGIFLAVVVIPLGILFLLIGLPIILHARKKRRYFLEHPEAAAEAAQKKKAREASRKKQRFKLKRSRTAASDPDEKAADTSGSSEAE